MPKIKAMPRPTGGVVGWIMPEMDGSGRFIEFSLGVNSPSHPVAKENPRIV
jgi:hypothetical protein